jgi:hypothetical protein
LNFKMATTFYFSNDSLLCKKCLMRLEVLHQAFFTKQQII